MASQDIRNQVLSNKVFMRLTGTDVAQLGGFRVESSDAVDFDVDVYVARFNDETVAAVRAVAPDVRIRVLQGSPPVRHGEPIP